jgi:RNA polymerase sigma factor (TIGR02999 family)
VTDVTRILSAIEQGEPRAAERLLPLVYEQLRKLAAHKLAHEKRGQTLQATALVHEAYLRLVDQDQPQDWDGRGHFFAAAAEAMRRILVEAARAKAREKRGGRLRRVEFSDHPAADTKTDTDPHDELIALDGALTKLAEEDPLAARVIELRRFAGLGHEDVAAALGITVYAARQKWTYARAWLRDAISGE